jgi:hypothetical protein
MMACCGGQWGGLTSFLLGLPVEANGEDVLVVKVGRGLRESCPGLGSGEVTARPQMTLENALARLQPSLNTVVGYSGICRRIRR